MDQETHKELSARLDTNNNFRLDEFPNEKQPIITAYLFGALYAGKEIRLKYENESYSIKETQAGLVNNRNPDQPMDFETLSDMLYDGAKVRIK
jgi:hypothetical protein